MMNDKGRRTRREWNPALRWLLRVSWSPCLIRSRLTLVSPCGFRCAQSDCLSSFALRAACRWLPAFHSGSPVATGLGSRARSSLALEELTKLDIGETPRHREDRCPLLPPDSV
jgi:hypothetical protein